MIPTSGCAPLISGFMLSELQPLIGPSQQRCLWRVSGPMHGGRMILSELYFGPGGTDIAATAADYLLGSDKLFIDLVKRSGGAGGGRQVSNLPFQTKMRGVVPSSLSARAGVGPSQDYSLCQRSCCICGRRTSVFQWFWAEIASSALPHCTFARPVLNPVNRARLPIVLQRPARQSIFVAPDVIRIGPQLIAGSVSSSITLVCIKKDVE